MHDTIFREYDIRGIVGVELQLEAVYDLGKAIGYYFLSQRKGVKTIAVGMDGRIHSEYIKDELIRALRDSGLNVLFVGLCPTPVLYFSLHTLPVDAGLMVTASHNGKEYNGIKLCLGKDALWGTQITAIKKLYQARISSKAMLKGSYEEYPMNERYTNWLVAQFAHLANSSLAAVIDCANGATSVIMPELIDKMKWRNMSLLFAKVDGNFPHHEPDPMVLENLKKLQKKIISSYADIGIGFDGDGDRMAALTKRGTLVDGDKLLGVFAESMAKLHRGMTVVFDIKCSSSLVDILKSWGAHPVMAPSGHSIIKHEMKIHKALLAGEISGHYYFNDRYFGFDDGIYAVLRLFELMNTGTSLEELLALFPISFSTPEIRIECAQSLRHTLIDSAQKYFSSQDTAQVCTIDGLRATLPYGWGLVRFSNTQPVVSLRFESATKLGLEQIKQDFYGVLKEYIDPAVLDKSLMASST